MAQSPAQQVLSYLHTQRHADNVKPQPADFGGSLTETEIQQTLADLTARDFITSNGKLTIRGSMAIVSAVAGASSPSASQVSELATPSAPKDIKDEGDAKDIAAAPATAVPVPQEDPPAPVSPLAFEVVSHTSAAEVAAAVPPPAPSISPNNHQPNQTQTNMAQSIKPLGARVLVKRVEAEEKTAGGLFIPDNAKEKPQEAEVIELGTGGRDEDGKEIPFNVKKGDLVLISKYGGTEVKVDGNDLLIISESDILGIVTK
jgi:chaperonin GroES